MDFPHDIWKWFDNVRNVIFVLCLISLISEEEDIYVKSNSLFMGTCMPLTVSVSARARTIASY